LHRTARPMAHRWPDFRSAVWTRSLRYPRRHLAEDLAHTIEPPLGQRVESDAALVEVARNRNLQAVPEGGTAGRSPKPTERLLSIVEARDTTARALLVSSSVAFVVTARSRTGLPYLLSPVRNRLANSGCPADRPVAIQPSARQAFARPPVPEHRAARCHRPVN
jgi:hypothetical protein